MIVEFWRAHVSYCKVSVFEFRQFERLRGILGKREPTPIVVILQQFDSESSKGDLLLDSMTMSKVR